MNVNSILERVSVWLPKASRFEGCRNFLQGCLLTLLVLAGKWILVERCAGEVPFADQWAGEGETIYAPVLRGDWSWNRLFDAWNEHRIVPTRILSVVLFTLTGRQWDPTVEVAISSLVHAFWLGFMACWLMRRTQCKWHAWICTFAMAIGILPFAYENTLSGFQSQFYFLLLFSTLAGWGLLGAPAGKLQWWGGVLAGASSVVSVGSGGLIGGSVLAVLFLRSVKRGRLAPGDGWTGLVATALLGITWAIRVEVAGHAKLAADSWTGFSLSGWRLVAWPFPSLPLMALAIWMPCGILLFRCLKSRISRLDSLNEAAFFLAVFAITQLMAIAVARGTTLVFSPLSSRYQDILVVGLSANFLAAIQLHSGIGHGRWMRLIMPVWVFVVVAGLVNLSSQVAMNSLGPWRQVALLERDQLALYLRTGHRPELENIGRSDREAARLIKTWEGKFAPALPPALQARIPAGFGFSASARWDEGGFDPPLGPPGGYAVWGSWLEKNLTVGSTDITSTPFLHTRGAVALSYALSPHWGRCDVEFVASDDRVVAAFSVTHTPGGDPLWREVNLRLAPGTYRLRIHDTRDEGRFAVTSPREMSLIGYFTRLGLKHSEWLFVMAGIGLVVLVSQSRGRED